MWTIAKTTGRPLHPDFPTMWDWPYTLTRVVMYRIRYDSYLELADPVPEEYWDHPHLVRKHIDRQMTRTLDVPPDMVEQ